MRYLLLICLLFIIGFSSAQQNISLDKPGDSLKKYSYYLIGYSNVTPNTTGASFENLVFGTGFFFRKNGSIFFATAKHILSGCDGTTKIKNYPDIINIWLADKDGNPSDMIPINIKAIKDTTSCLPLDEDPDVMVIKMNDIRLSNVNSVENFVSPVLKKVREIEIFGFPENETDVKSNTLYTHPSNLYIKANAYEVAEVTKTNTGKKDTINHYVYTDKVHIDNSLHGYSGSPVFVKDASSDKWRLMGTMCGHSDTIIDKEKYVCVVNVNYLLKEIKKRNH